MAITQNKKKIIRRVEADVIRRVAECVRGEEFKNFVHLKGQKNYQTVAPVAVLPTTMVQGKARILRLKFGVAEKQRNSRKNDKNFSWRSYAELQSALDNASAIKQDNKGRRLAYGKSTNGDWFFWVWETENGLNMLVTFWRLSLDEKQRAKKLKKLGF